MPWTHCDTEIQDDRPCPACGASKRAWTVRLSATRVFQVGNRISLEIELLDDTGSGIADAEYVLRLPKRQRVGTTDADGRALEKKVPGDKPIEVEFPDFPAESLTVEAEELPDEQPPRRLLTFRRAGWRIEEVEVEGGRDTLELGPGEWEIEEIDVIHDDPGEEDLGPASPWEIEEVEVVSGEPGALPPPGAAPPAEDEPWQISAVEVVEA